MPGHAAASETRWSVCVRFAIDAGSEDEARAIASAVLDQVGLNVAGRPAAVCSDKGFWAVRADIDLSGLSTAIIWAGMREDS
jgi:hypothetical protein